MLLTPPPTPTELVPRRMRIGDAMVDVATREIDSPHARRPLRVTPKAMAVLCVLAGQPGQVVSREVLLARVWPDTLPTDDVLTQAIAQLRKAFGPGGRDYIETIAKGGYRLLSPVEDRAPADAIRVEAPPAAGVAQPEPEPQPRPGILPAGTCPAPAAAPRMRRARPALVAVLAMLALGMLAWLLGQDGSTRASKVGQGAPAAALERPYRVISTAPGFELWPTLSPDASMVAYSAIAPGEALASIQVQPTVPASPRQLGTPPPGASDSLPAWSPDGREIAFARRYADGRCGIMIVPANGAGAEREVVAGCNAEGLLSFSWTPDQASLLFGTMGGGGGDAGISLLGLADGEWRPVAYDAGDGIDHAPQVSPDGRWIVFVRNPQLGDLWRIPAGGGKAEQLTSMGAEIRGWSWLSDSRSLVFSSRVDAGTRLYRLDVDSRQVTDLGFSDAQAPAVAAANDALAFVRRNPRFGIHRVVHPGPDGGPLRVERMFKSSGRDVLPSVSPDGRQIVFGSDRTGHFELWWADMDEGGSLRPVEGLRPDARHLPAWSPDGRKVLVSGWQEAGDPGIFEVEPASGRLAALPIPGERPLNAVYLPEPSRLLVTEESGEGGARLVLYERSVQPWRALRTVEDVSQMRVDAGRERILFTRLSADGLWQADLELSPGSIEPVSVGAPLRWRYRAWAVSGDGAIEYLDWGRGCPARLTRIGGVDSVPPRCMDRERPGSTNGFSIDPRSGDLYLALAVEDGTDIAFLDQPERIARPETWFSKVLKMLTNPDS